MKTHMENASISFPMLGDFSINPPASFRIGPLTVHWYGVIIATGFLLAVLYCAKHAKEYGMKPDNVYDVIILGVPLAIICARIYFCVFHWDLFRDNPISVLYIWEGGIGMYGVIAGAVLATVVYCRKNKLSILAFLDMVCFGFIIGQFIGRWGNFMNREAFGYETDIFCKMGLTENGVTYYVHPTFLYESLWNFVGFLLMHFWWKKHRSYDGQMLLAYLAWYGFGRMLVEGLRTDSLYLFNTGIRVSQLVSFVLLIASAAILMYNRFIRHPDPAKMFVNRQKAAAAQAAAQAQSVDESPERPDGAEKVGDDPEEESHG